MDLSHPFVIVGLLVLIAVVAVAILPGAVGWVFAGLCLLAALAILVGRGPRTPRT